MSPKYRDRRLAADAPYFDDYMVAFPPRAWFGTPSMVIHNSVFTQVGSFDSEKRVGEDLDMWFRIGLKYPKVGYGPAVACNSYERVDSLSGGQMQRTSIARALYQEPEALLADEPVSSVDPARARDTVALLTRIAREEGITLCVSLHNLELAREFFPRLIGMRHGQVVFDCSTDELADTHFDDLYELTAGEMLRNA